MFLSCTLPAQALRGASTYGTDTTMGKKMGQNEAGVTEVFVTELKELAHAAGIDFVPFPLGPLDRHMLSDSLFANNFDHFALVEMKFSDEQLKSEANKRLRVEALCKALAGNAEMRKLHEQCHMIAWSDVKTGELKCSPYRDQICNQSVLGPSCGLEVQFPDASKVVDVIQFGSDFFGDPAARCLAKKAFEKYAVWLLKVVSDSRIEQLKVIARGRNLENKPIATCISFEQMCHDLNIRKKKQEQFTKEEAIKNKRKPRRI